MSNDTKKDFFWGFLLGALTATAAGVFLSTKKGKELRNSLGEFYDEVKDSVKEVVTDAKERGEEQIEHLGKVLADDVEKAEKGMENLSKKVAQKAK